MSSYTTNSMIKKLRIRILLTHLIPFLLDHLLKSVILGEFLGPVVQWSEPSAHNGVVAGSNPAGPTTILKELPCHLTNISTL